VLLKRVATALGPGAQVAILDEVPTRRVGNVGRAFGSIMALNMYMAADAQTYTSDEIGHWLRAAGFGTPTTKRLVRTPGLALMVARLS
jgi:hypothetical protein